MRTTTNKDLELKELIKQGTNILNEIKVIEHTIEMSNDAMIIFELDKAKTKLQEQFNEIFDKVFDVR